MGRQRIGSRDKARAKQNRPGFEFLVALAVVLLGVFSVMTGLDTRLLVVARPATEHPTRLLDETLDDLAHRPFDEVASLQGDVRRLGQGEAGQRYRVDLAVSQSSLGLLEIQAVLFDRQLARPVDRLVTYLSKSARQADAR